MEYHCGIYLNEISGLIKVIHVFDDQYYYHSDKIIGQIKTERSKKGFSKYNYFFKIPEEAFLRLQGTHYNDIKQKSIPWLVEQFNLHEWII